MYKTSDGMHVNVESCVYIMYLIRLLYNIMYIDAC